MNGITHEILINLAEGRISIDEAERLLDSHSALKKTTQTASPFYGLTDFGRENLVW